ncbi:MAG: ribonuclease P protein component [Pseudohongiellaceae bacterium]
MADNGFKRSCRLLNASDYKNVFDKSQLKVSNKSFLVLACVNNQQEPRLGLVVAKKNVNKAVHRNRIKRNIRQSFRCNKDVLRNLDLVVLARKDADKLDGCAAAIQLDQLWKDLARKLTRLNIPSKTRINE